MKMTRRNRGFTIVELLVVIVVIGVLAAISLVSYSGISRQATVASIKSDISNSTTQLKLYNAHYGHYPETLDANNCPTGPADPEHCLRTSLGNTFSYSSSGPAYSTFTLDVTNTSSNIVYRITDNSVAGEVLPLGSIGSISGTAQVGETLTAGSLLPSGATASYQWQSAPTSNGTYSNISGATSNSYLLVGGDVGKFIKVVATGTNTYSGSVTSTNTSVVVPMPPIFASGGSIVDSGGYRTHTFAPGTVNITSLRSGLVDITILGAGGGAGGPIWEDYCGAPGDGTAGGLSKISKSGVDWQANGGGGGSGTNGGYCGGSETGINGAAGTTNTPSGWTATNGGGSVGGSKYYWGSGLEWEGYGSNGGSGGKLEKNGVAVSIGEVYSVTVGAMGQTNGTPGVITIRYAQ